VLHVLKLKRVLLSRVFQSASCIDVTNFGLSCDSACRLLGSRVFDRWGSDSRGDGVPVGQQIWPGSSRLIVVMMEDAAILMGLLLGLLFGRNIALTWEDQSPRCPDVCGSRIDLF